MGRRLPLNIIRRVLDFAVGAVFIYAGASKMLDTGRFALDVSNYQLLPWTAGALVAMYLPFLEIVAGAAVILRKLYLGAIGLLTGLTLVFLGILASAWFRGIDIHCGCFGHEHPHSVGQAIGLDVILLAATGFLMVMAWKDAATSQETSPLDSPSLL